MYFFFSTKRMYIIFFLVILYLIQIVIGSPKPESSFIPPQIFTTQILRECFYNIHRYFKINVEERSNVNEFVQNAIKYLRYGTKAEIDAYKNNLEPGEGFSPFLLYDGEIGSIFKDEFSFRYYQFLENQQLYVGLVRTPNAFCKRKTICLRVLENFGFVGNDRSAITRNAFSKIVLHDIQSCKVLPPDIDVLFKMDAKEYMTEVADSVRTDSTTMVWPEIYCMANFQ